MWFSSLDTDAKAIPTYLRSYVKKYVETVLEDVSTEEAMCVECAVCRLMEQASLKAPEFTRGDIRGDPFRRLCMSVRKGLQDLKNTRGKSLIPLNRIHDRPPYAGLLHGPNHLPKE